MAHRGAMHARNDSGVSVNSFIIRDNPPSPTLTNPDMIVPIPPWARRPAVGDDDDQGPHPLLEPEHDTLTQTLSNSTTSTPRHSTGELGVATAVLMPSRLTAPLPTSIHPHGSATQVAMYTGYEHGAPLSDIYEESEATATPRSSRTVRNHQEQPQSPTPAERDRSTTPTRPSLRHKKRVSSLSTSSSGGSDVGDWENFDSSMVLSSRVAADLAQMKRDDMLEIEPQEVTSRRQSREEEELAALNARAEKILENARKRLTNMEDNLKVARNSIIMPQRSPNLGGEHQPVGGLYRSISAAGATKLAKNRQIVPIRTSASLQHLRGNSETGISSTNKRFSRLEERSASALEYGSPMRYSLFPDTSQTTPSKTQPSPSSSRSFNSPLRPLQEEEKASPSTAETTPESMRVPTMRGLGIHRAATVSREHLATPVEQSAPRQQQTPPQLLRSTSSGSTKSAKELKEQMIDLKSRIADLRSKAKADHLRRRSLQSNRSPSPLANAEQWYAGSPAYKESGSPLHASAGVGGETPASPVVPQDEAELYDEQMGVAPETPADSRFLDIGRMTPDTEARMLSSARTDRNTPSLVRKRSDFTNGHENNDSQNGDSPIRQHSISEYSDGQDYAENEGNSTGQIAENEEEQIYLNEVLEESLREAEVEPEVPPIPSSYFGNAEGDSTFENTAAERHEDRLDAFDYENMFLHSAMGTYTGKSINGSDSGSDEQSDDDRSVETSRAGARTPVDVSSADDEPEISEGLNDVDENEPEFRRSLVGSNYIPQSQVRSPLGVDLPAPPMPRIHTRSKSIDSVSTSATFETATEGEEYDETPNEIFNWDPVPSSSLGYSPTSHAAYRTAQNTPARSRYGFSSPQGGGRSTPIATKSPNGRSPLRPRQGEHFEPIYDHKKASASPGIGLGVMGGENAQYINDNGVPQRFQGKQTPSPGHSRQSSMATPGPSSMRPESQATVTAASPAKGPGHKRLLSASRIHGVPPLLSSSNNKGSPILVTIAASPQRKVVINRSLQQPESYILEPHTVDSSTMPPDGSLPPPPTSSTVLQAQMASPERIDSSTSKIRRSHSLPKRTAAQYQQQPLPLQQTQAQPQTTWNDTASSAAAQPIPNVEILMESLIKLADPSFTLAPGIRFDEVDKNLVLGLLGAVGGVCNSVLTASIQSGSPAMGRIQAGETVDKLRRRLEAAAHVLEGRDEGRTSVSRQGLRIKEI
ncbi:hypothetical protein LTR05_001362 [Lithohypha guttulata]|uniref:Uncharacterized protein n=1 Tax=Lithohypha guttulata TaxID=1690604 RepID=A0AAN7YAA4_9EURO|nr:hypothetical protein LTR05_001362 [Lithohypha guttulata]